MNSSVYHFMPLKYCLTMLGNNHMLSSEYDYTFQISHSKTFNKNAMRPFISTTRNSRFDAGFTLQLLSSCDFVCRVELDTELLNSKFKRIPIWVDGILRSDEPDFFTNIKKREFGSTNDTNFLDMQEERFLVPKYGIYNINKYIKSITVAGRQLNIDYKQFLFEITLLDNYCKQYNIPLRFVDQTFKREISQDEFQNTTYLKKKFNASLYQKNIVVAFGFSQNIVTDVQNAYGRYEIQANKAVNKIYRYPRFEYQKILSNQNDVFEFIINNIYGFIDYVYEALDKIIDRQILTDNIICICKYNRNNLCFVYKIQNGELMQIVDKSKASLEIDNYISKY